MSGMAAITSSSKTGTVATYLTASPPKVSEAVIVYGLVTNSALNFASPRIVTAVSAGVSFSVGGFASGTIGSVSEAGVWVDPLEWLGEGDTSGEWLAGGTEKYLGPSGIQVNPAETEYAFIYVNGSHTLADPHNKIHLIEEEFQRRMFEDESFESLE